MSYQSLAGVIFDLDGVLVTTDHFHYRAWKALAVREKLFFDETVNHKLRGVSRESSLKAIYDHNGRPYPVTEIFKEQCTWKNNEYVKLIGQMTEKDILPGALGLLNDLRLKGIKCAIASASKNAQTVLARTGLLSKMDAVSDGNNITASKPDPQVFTMAATMLGLSCKVCIGIEDAASGVEAIHRAGMTAIGIGDQTAAAEYQVKSVLELSADRIGKVYAQFSVS